MKLSSLFKLPEQASAAASQVDSLYLYLVGVSVFFFALIVFLVAFFSYRYRRKKNQKAKQIHGHNVLEIVWTVVPLVFVMSFFIWGMLLFFGHFRAPGNALEVFVVGKQWMWKLQHPAGPREINELHIPVNHPVKLTITSEDVIHSFYVPAFRIKMDAVPGRYTRTWFEATKTGKYRLLCAEFCGTDHSQMIGWIYVMEQEEYQAWISERTGKETVLGDISEGTPRHQGEQLFNKHRCFACHNPQSGALGPNLAGVFGEPVRLSSGKMVTADEDYLKESIQKPMAKVVEGYSALMPTYEKILSENEIFAIIEYLKSLPKMKSES